MVVVPVVFSCRGVSDILVYGGTIYAGSTDGVLYIFDATRQSVKLHTASILSIHVYKDTVITYSRDGTIALLTDVIRYIKIDSPSLGFCKAVLEHGRLQYPTTTHIKSLCLDTLQTDVIGCLDASKGMIISLPNAYEASADSVIGSSGEYLLTTNSLICKWTVSVPNARCIHSDPTRVVIGTHGKFKVYTNQGCKLAVIKIPFDTSVSCCFIHEGNVYVGCEYGVFKYFIQE